MNVLMGSLPIVGLFIFSSLFSTYDSEHYELEVVTIAEELEHPWSLAFLPTGDMLVTERSGQLRLISDKGQISKAVSGLPLISPQGQGGLLDIALHPDYGQNGWLYITYASANKQGNGTEVARAKFDSKNLRLTDLEVIFRMSPKSGGGRHFGSRMAFDQAGYLYVTLGDRGEKDAAQRLDDHRGKIIRLNDDGSIPPDNPFINTPNALPEIYSYGHRNPQGMTFNHKTKTLWQHEHGPQGGDEVNIIQRGKNYGWPIITYGVNYVFATKIGEGTHKEGMLQPIHYWVPTSIAPSGMSFYHGDKFPKWQGNLFIGTLRRQMLVRLVIENDKVVHEEHIFEEELGRIRDVRQGPDGFLYLLSDADDGKILRIQPSDD